MDIMKQIKKIFEKPPALNLDEEYPRPENGNNNENNAKKYW